MHLVPVEIRHHRCLHSFLTLSKMSCEYVEAPLLPCNVQGQAEDSGHLVEFLLLHSHQLAIIDCIINAIVRRPLNFSLQQGLRSCNLRVCRVHVAGRMQAPTHQSLIA